MNEVFNVYIELWSFLNSKSFQSSGLSIKLVDLIDLDITDLEIISYLDSAFNELEQAKVQTKTSYHKANKNISYRQK